MSVGDRSAWSKEFRCIKTESHPEFKWRPNGLKNYRRFLDLREGSKIHINKVVYLFRFALSEFVGLSFLKYGR